MCMYIYINLYIYIYICGQTGQGKKHRPAPRIALAVCTHWIDKQQLSSGAN